MISCATQLADFADSCQLPRLLVANRLKFLVKKLAFAMKKGIELAINEEERSHLNQYQRIINKRCDHLLLEAPQIVSIKL